MTRSGMLVAVALFGCAGPALESAPRPARNAPGRVASGARSALPEASVRPSPSSSVEALPPTATISVELVQVLDVPVSAFALGEGSRIAVLADQPWLGDARGLAPKPFPRALQPRAGQVDALEIFFGRDNEPRVLGARRDDAGDRPIYWRHLASGWREGREEIARLGEPGSGALWGLLGAEDPELVCRVSSHCIVKRRTGWKVIPSGSAPRITTLQDGVLWSITDAGLERLGPQGFQLAIAAPLTSDKSDKSDKSDTPEASVWSAPRHALWATEKEAWVCTARGLLHYKNEHWAVRSSPIGEVWSLWGKRADSLWLAGTLGAAHFDGSQFRKLPLSGPLRVVRGRSDREVWFGGEPGLFRASSSIGN